MIDAEEVVFSEREVIANLNDESIGTIERLADAFDADDLMSCAIALLEGDGNEHCLRSVARAWVNYCAEMRGIGNWRIDKNSTPEDYAKKLRELREAAGA